MKTTKATLPKAELKLTIELDVEETAKYRTRTLEKLGKNITLPGFRQGMAPAEMVERHVGEQALMGELLDIAIPESYAKVIIDEKIPVLTRPKVTLTSADPITFEAVVATLPEVKVKNYKSIKIASRSDEVEEKEIDEILENFRKQNATYHDVTRAIQKGDKVEIDFEGFDKDGKPLVGAASKNHPLIVGDNMLIPGFEDALIGMMKGEKKRFPLTFPKDYHHEPLKGKQVEFDVTIKEHKEVKLPELTEELLEKAVGKKQPLDEVKKDLRERMAKEKKRDNRMKREDDFLGKILEGTTCDISDMLIDDEVDYMLEQMKAEMKERGVEWDRYMAATKKSEDDIRKEYREEAIKRIKIRLALQHIFKEEKVEVNEDEMKQEIEAMAAQYPEGVRAKMTEQIEKDPDAHARIKNRIMLRKFFDQYIGAEQAA